MTIEQVAQRLNDCAIKKYCSVCIFSCYGHKTELCQGHMIKAMGNECRKIVEESEDDGK